ncbi:MAG TPA: hypothetical protein VIW25_00460 [Nitrososphaeraceae archaeon]
MATQVRRKKKREQKKKNINIQVKAWVVQRTHSWMNRFRRLLIRWEKKVGNYIGMLHFACAWITYRCAELFGQALRRA